MAPIEPFASDSNLIPIAGIAGTTAAAFGSLFTITRSFVKLRTALPISSRTRGHESQRRNHVILFASLAVMSLLVNVYNTVEVLVDSYTNFVTKNSVVPKTDIWTSPVWYPRAEDINALKLRAWLSSRDMEEAAEALINSARDSWWFKQLQAATVIWALFLAIQGRRHNVPRTWAYLLLATFFGLSVSVNLFFVALLLTPVPYEKATKRPRSRSTAERPGRLLTLMRRLHLTRATNRSATWTPKLVVYLVPLAVGLLSPIASSQLSNLPVELRLWSTGLPVGAALSLFLIEYTGMLPTRFGTAHSSLHAAHHSYTRVFRTASLFALLNHFASSLLAITANAPPISRTRYRILSSIPTALTPDSISSAIGSDTVATYNTSIQHAIAAVLGAFSDHPLVQLIGWDVLLTGLSLCLWAGVRGLEPGDMLKCSGLPSGVVNAPSKAKARVKRVANRGVEKSKKAAKEAENSAKEAEKAVMSTASSIRDTPGAKSHKRAGSRAASTMATSARRSVSGTKASRTPARGRVSAEAQPVSALDPEGEEVDPTFHPSAEVESTVEHDEHLEPVDVREQCESAAVAWGLLVLGGLGVGMGGVGGGEIV